MGGIRAKTFPVPYTYEHEAFPGLLADSGLLNLNISGLSAQINVTLMLGEYPTAHVQKVSTCMGDVCVSLSGSTASIFAGSCLAAMWQRQVEELAEAQICTSLDAQLSAVLPTFGTQLAVSVSTFSAIRCIAVQSGEASCKHNGSSNGGSVRSALCQALGLDRLQVVDADALAHAIPLLVFENSTIDSFAAGQSVVDIIATLNGSGAFDSLLHDLMQKQHTPEMSLLPAAADADGTKPTISPSRAAAARARRVSKQLSGDSNEIAYIPEPFRHTPVSSPEKCAGPSAFS